jgi:hypothetical protein
VSAKRFSKCARNGAITAVVALSGLLALAQGAGKAQRPDLHAGGPDPSLIPNHEVTVVTLPGFHLAGAKVAVKGVCKLASYKVASDTQIEMSLEGARSIADKDNGCYFTVTTPAGSAEGWLSVDLTDDEKAQQESKQKADDRAKAQAFVSAAGKKWQLRFADGATETYTAKPQEGEGMPSFTTHDGKPASIIVKPDNSAILIDGQCMRKGHLMNGQVKDGQSMGNCSHSGAWTASVDR